MNKILILIITFFCIIQISQSDEYMYKSFGAVLGADKNYDNYLLNSTVDDEGNFYVLVLMENDDYITSYYSDTLDPKLIKQYRILIKFNNKNDFEWGMAFPTSVGSVVSDGNSVYVSHYASAKEREEDSTRSGVISEIDKDANVIDKHYFSYLPRNLKYLKNNFYAYGREYPYNDRYKIATKDAHQTNDHIKWEGSRDEKLDAYLVKYDKNFNTEWGTYYGGNENDEALDLEIDSLGNIYLTGRTESDNNEGKIATENAFQNTFIKKDGAPQNVKGFLVKFDESGKRKWGTYVGCENHELVNDIEIDEYNNIYALLPHIDRRDTNTVLCRELYSSQSNLDTLITGSSIIKFTSEGDFIKSNYINQFNNNSISQTFCIRKNKLLFFAFGTPPSKKYFNKEYKYQHSHKQNYENKSSFLLELNDDLILNNAIMILSDINISLTAQFPIREIYLTNNSEIVLTYNPYERNLSPGYNIVTSGNESNFLYYSIFFNKFKTNEIKSELPPITVDKYLIHEGESIELNINKKINDLTLEY